MTSGPDDARVEAADLRSQVAELRRAEEAFAAAWEDFERLRNFYDSAGELALYEGVRATQARLDAIKEVLNGLLELREEPGSGEASGARES